MDKNMLEMTLVKHHFFESFENDHDADSLSLFVEILP